MAFSIKSVAPRLFNSTKYETSVARNSNPIGKDIKNPFKTDIKMDVLSADVFGNKPETSTISKIKRMASTFVGSIGDAFPTFRKGIETVTAFCKRCKDSTVSFWNMMTEKEVPNIFDATRSIKSKWDTMNYNKAVNKLAQSPVPDLENMLVKELSLNTAA